jgi:NAD-dependent SIR2 family protein deacetylase
VNLLDIHHTSTKNKDYVLKSKKCGCFKCCNIFDASKVTKWEPEHAGHDTAKCPVCGSDSVICDAVVKVEARLLDLMYNEYYGDDD